MACKTARNAGKLLWIFTAVLFPVFLLSGCQKDTHEWMYEDCVKPGYVPPEAFVDVFLVDDQFYAVRNDGQLYQVDSGELIHSFPNSKVCWGEAQEKFFYYDQESLYSWEIGQKEEKLVCPINLQRKGLLMYITPDFAVFLLLPPSYSSAVAVDLRTGEQQIIEEFGRFLTSKDNMVYWADFENQQALYQWDLSEANFRVIGEGLPQNASQAIIFGGSIDQEKLFCIFENELFVFSTNGTMDQKKLELPEVPGTKRGFFFWNDTLYIFTDNGLDTLTLYQVELSLEGVPHVQKLQCWNTDAKEILRDFSLERREDGTFCFSAAKEKPVIGTVGEETGTDS